MKFILTIPIVLVAVSAQHNRHQNQNQHQNQRQNQHHQRPNQFQHHNGPHGMGNNGGDYGGDYRGDYRGDNGGGYSGKCDPFRYKYLINTTYYKNNQTFVKSNGKWYKRDLERDQPVKWLEGCLDKKDLPEKIAGTLYVQLDDDKKVKRFSCNGYRDKDAQCNKYKSQAADDKDSDSNDVDKDDDDDDILEADEEDDDDDDADDDEGKD